LRLVRTLNFRLKAVLQTVTTGSVPFAVCFIINVRFFPEARSACLAHSRDEAPKTCEPWGLVCAQSTCKEAEIVIESH